MGYFNYFIKCIIRNIAYRLCKPKVLLTILLAFAILFGLKHYGFCALDDTDYEMISDGFATITSNQGVMISHLSSIGVDVKDLENSLSQIKSALSAVQGNQATIATQINNLCNKIDILNTNILNIYNKLDSNQKQLIETLEKNQDELISELQAENEKVLNELQELRDALVGSEATAVTAQDQGIATITSASGTTSGVRKIYIPMQYKYTYKVTVTYKNTSSSDININYLFSSIDSEKNQNVSGSLARASTVPANSTVSFTLTTRDYTKPYLYLTYGYNYQSVSVTGSIEGVADVIDRTNQEISSGIQQGNQLQQEQNQLQQEQNNILKDDNVSTDGFEFATNDAVNPTEEGFNTLFTSIYNAFCNTSSKPLTITLPYVNETFTIQPNLVSNAMQKCGLGFVATLIHSFYYYNVCLFIYKDINKIIEHLKSGNLTADCGNVKTEVL